MDYYHPTRMRPQATERLRKEAGNVNEFRLNSQHEKEIDKRTLDPYEHEKQRRLRPHQRWEDQLIALARGKLSDQQRAEVERHLQTCERCAEAYRAYREVSQLLRLAAPRTSLLKESGIAYDAALPRKPRLPSVDMPPGIPRQMREYMEKYVVFPDPPQPVPGPDAAPEATDQTPDYQKQQ